MLMGISSLSDTRYYDKIKNLAVAFFMFMLVGRFINLYWALPRKIDSVAFLGISFFAILFVCLDLIKNKKIYTAPNLMCLLFFTVSCAVSCLIYVEYGWAGNLKSLISIFVSLFFLYPFASVNGIEKTKKIIIILQKILVVMWFVAALISIITFLLQYSSIFYVGGTRILVGCIENRLFGLFSDPNYASIVSILTIIFSVAILNYKNQSKLMRIICVCNIFAQFIYIVLGASRTGEVCLLLTLLVSSFVYSYKLNPSRKFYAVVIRIFAAFCLCVFAHYLIGAIRILLSYAPSLFKAVFGVDYSQSGFVLHQVSMERPDVAQTTDISNLRFRIWGSALEIFRTTWLFGASPRNALLYAGDVLPKSFIVTRGYDAHNFYVAILLYTGLLGAIFLGFFLIKSAYLIIKHYFKNHFSVSDVFFNSLALSALCIAASGMFLSEILFITTLGSFFFWLFLGYIMSTIDCKSKCDFEDR